LNPPLPGNQERVAADLQVCPPMRLGCEPS
jgi:hypothetical protein